MQIQKLEHIAKLNDSTSCNIYYAEIIIDDVQTEAIELTKIITENSWISSLDLIAKMSYAHNVERTVKELISIFQNPLNINQQKVSKEFGEYMISLDSQRLLQQSLNHKVFPLSELWKEKVSGNGGFDFHTESEDNFLTFGEAKFRSNGNAYTDSAEQIRDFIKPEKRKDYTDAVHLQKLNATPISLDNLNKDKRNFVVAFSVNSESFEVMKQNCFNNSDIRYLSGVAETLFVFGVHVQ